MTHAGPKQTFNLRPLCARSPLNPARKDAADHAGDDTVAALASRLAWRATLERPVEPGTEQEVAMTILSIIATHRARPPNA